MSSSKQSEPTGPKVLRIGIVQRGKIIDERELKKRETVSVGTHQKAMFQVQSDALPRSFDLFDYDGKTYFVRFTDKMDGRIQLEGTKVQNFPELEAQGKVVMRGDSKAVELSDDSRGKVVIGDVTVLFQFKALVPTPVRPVLPADVRGSLLQNIDAQFTGIFVAVAVLQISIVTYARSLPYIEPTSIDEIDQDYQRLIMPDRLPEPPKDAVADDGAGEKEKEKAPEEKKKEPSKAKGQNKGKVDEEAAARARKEAIRKQVAGKGLLKVLGAKGTGRDAGALNDVFSDGGVTGQLGDAFSGIQGVDIADNGGESGTRGGGSGEGVGIGALGTEGGGSFETGTKSEYAVKGSVKEQAPEVDGELSQAEIARVMRRQLNALRDCYERALKRNRKLSGKLIIKFEILESGRTSNVEFEDASLNSPDVRQCIESRAKYWRFPKPDGGSVFVAYPIIFTPAG
jgi:hypothetical protein